MDYRLFGVKPLPKPTLTYRTEDPLEWYSPENMSNF